MPESVVPAPPLLATAPQSALIAPRSKSLVSQAALSGNHSNCIPQSFKEEISESLQENGRFLLTSASPLSAEFIGPKFSDKYQRNNKRGGLKNLRCFPACSPGHKERGFCGLPVKVRVTTCKHEGLIAFAQFSQVPEPLEFNMGRFYSKSTIMSQVRTSDEPQKPFILAEATGNSARGLFFEFNKRRKGWHYGWTANKHSCNTQHCLRVFVMRETASNELLRCEFVLSSNPFVLYCRRRRRFIKDPEHKTSETLKRRRTEVGDCTSLSGPVKADRVGHMKAPLDVELGETARFLVALSQR